MKRARLGLGLWLVALTVWPVSSLTRRSLRSLFLLVVLLGSGAGAGLGIAAWRNKQAAIERTDFGDATLVIEATARDAQTSHLSPADTRTLLDALTPIARLDDTIGGPAIVSETVRWPTLSVAEPRAPDVPARVRGLDPFDRGTLALFPNVTLVAGKLPRPFTAIPAPIAGDTDAETPRELLVGLHAASFLDVPEAWLSVGAHVTLEGMPFVVVGRFAAGASTLEDELLCHAADLHDVIRPVVRGLSIGASHSTTPAYVPTTSGVRLRPRSDADLARVLADLDRTAAQTQPQPVASAANRALDRRVRQLSADDSAADRVTDRRILREGAWAFALLLGITAWIVVVGVAGVGATTRQLDAHTMHVFADMGRVRIAASMLAEGAWLGIVAAVVLAVAGLVTMITGTSIVIAESPIRLTADAGSIGTGAAIALAAGLFGYAPAAVQYAAALGRRRR